MSGTHVDACVGGAEALPTAVAAFLRLCASSKMQACQGTHSRSSPIDLQAGGGQRGRKQRVAGVRQAATPWVRGLGAT